MPPKKPPKDTADLPNWGKNPYGEPLTADGEHNLKWWAWETARVHTYGKECVEQGITSFRPSEWTRHLEMQMKMRGVNLAEMGNNKSDMLIMDHPEEWFEQQENTLRRMEEECFRLVKMSSKSDLVRLELVAGVTEVQKKKLERAIAIINRVIVLQQFCKNREPDPAICRKLNDVHEIKTVNQKTVLRCFHPMRVMLYARRSSASFNDVAPWDKVMHMAPHLCHLAISVTRSQELGAKGAMVELPPEHSKTEFGVCFCATEIANDPELNWAIVHHKSEHASNRVVNLREMMTPNNPMGRRFCALFPHVKVVGNKQNQHEFTVRRRSNDKDPTCRAFGINEAVQGMNLHRIWADDIVDAKEREEESTRRKTHRSFVGNFLPRLRGDGTFFLMTYTPWHLEDCHGLLKKTKMIKKVKNQLIYDIGVFQLPIGTSQDEFAPIWDRQGREKLKSIKRRLGDNALWDCLYHLNPISKATRIVQKLNYVYHDIDDEETKKFLGMSRMVLSIDPAGTVSKNSDKAGVVYMAVNESVPQIRVIEAFEVAANQQEIAAFAYEFMQSRPVHEIVVETISGYHATADELEFGYDLPNDVVHRITSHGNKSKAIRLKSVAIHFETGRISFVGTQDEKTGKIVGREDHHWVYDQILRFGSMNRDHVVDAIVQVAIKFAASLWEGYDPDEEARRQVEESKRAERCPRMLEHMKRLRRMRENNSGGHVNQMLQSVNTVTCVDEKEYGYNRWN